jgi:hypothetical protein
MIVQIVGVLIIIILSPIALIMALVSICLLVGTIGAILDPTQWEEEDTVSLDQTIDDLRYILREYYNANREWRNIKLNKQ